MDLVTLVKQWKSACIDLLESENGYTRDAFDCADSDLFHYLQDTCGESSEKMHHDITALLEEEVSILLNEVTTMRKGTYYLNNRGSKWVTFPKEKVLVFHGEEGYCKMRIIEHYESFGNFAVACFRYKGKMVKVFLEDCNGRQVAFVDYKEKY